MAISDKKYEELQTAIQSLSKKGQQQNETDLYQLSLNNSSSRRSRNFCK